MSTPQRNGCFDRPEFVEFNELSPTQKIPNFSFGQPCKYTDSDLGAIDEGCKGCKHQACPIPF